MIFQQINPIYRPTETDSPQQAKLQKTYDLFTKVVYDDLVLTPILSESVQRIKTLSELKASLDISLDETRGIADKRLSSDVISEYRSYFEGDDAQQLVDEVREAAKKAINLPDDTEVDMLLLDIVSPQKNWAIYHNIAFGDSGIYLILSPKHYMKIMDYNGKEVQEQMEKIFEEVLSGGADKAEAMPAIKKAITYNVLENVKDVFLSLAMQGKAIGVSQELIDKVEEVCIPGSHIDITKIDTKGSQGLKNTSEYSVMNINRAMEVVKRFGEWYTKRLWSILADLHNLEQAANLLSLMLQMNAYVRGQEGDDKFVLTGSPLRDVDGLKVTMTLMVPLKKAALPKAQGWKDCEPAKNAVKEWESGDYLRSISKESGDLLERKTSFLAGNIRHALSLEAGGGDTYNINALINDLNPEEAVSNGSEEYSGYSYATDVLACLVFMFTSSDWGKLTSEQRRFFAATASMMSDKSYGEDGKLSLPENLTEAEIDQITQLGFGDVASNYETLSKDAGKVLESKGKFAGFIKAQQQVSSGEEVNKSDSSDLEQDADMKFEKGQAISTYNDVLSDEVLKIIVFDNPADDD